MSRRRSKSRSRSVVQKIEGHVTAVIMMTSRFRRGDVVMVIDIMHRVWKVFMIKIPRQHVLDRRPTPCLRHN